MTERDYVPSLSTPYAVTMIYRDSQQDFKEVVICLAQYESEESAQNLVDLLLKGGVASKIAIQKIESFGENPDGGLTWVFGPFIRTEGDYPT